MLALFFSLETLHTHRSLESFGVVHQGSPERQSDGIEAQSLLAVHNG